MSNDDGSDDTELLKDIRSSPTAHESFYRSHGVEATRLLAGRSGELSRRGIHHKLRSAQRRMNPTLYAEVSRYSSSSR